MSCAASPPCPVCEADNTRFFETVDRRHYRRCERCHATFLDPAQLPGPEEELAEYNLHQNDPGDSGYRRFLQPLVDSLLTRLPTGGEGLDYGCGPGPALAAMLREAGHSVALFDPFFEPDPAVLERRYDFVACSETAEHFHHAAREFRRLHGLLKPGGWLGIMTCFQTDDNRFANWHYRRDPSHVVFYRETTFRQIAADLGWHCEIPCRNVALLQVL